MKRCELLSPAGNMEMLKSAIKNGADAVYLAGKSFGARKFADNFDNSALKDALDYAHLYGVKVYLTLNTLIFEEEVEEFLNYVEFVHEIGIDAVLIQDFGMLRLIRETFPNLEVHASTQMHNNSKEMLTLLEKFGVKRVVLDREMSLKEIENLPKSIETEVFCHGALCVSYSGQCLFSSLILNRSGNRGECAGMCRLPYKLEIDGKILDNKPHYYLSLKDLCTINQLDKILEVGVSCIKIEGRMKSANYVGYITRLYRKMIDSYYEGNFKSISEQEMKNIKLSFNRELTKGFINEEQNEHIVNIISPNHIGIPLGKYKTYGKKIELILDDELLQGDTIRFIEENKGMTVNFLYNKNGKLVSRAPSQSKAYVDNFLDINSQGEIRKVSSIKLDEEIKSVPERKVNIFGKIILQKRENIKIILSDYENHIEVIGPVPDLAKTKPISKEDIEKQFKKTGNTVYQFYDLEITLDDDIFVTIKTLNDLRRLALEELTKKRLSNKKDFTKREYCPEKVNLKRELELNITISTIEQFEAVKDYATNIFLQDDDLYQVLKGQTNVFKRYEEQNYKFEMQKYLIDDYGALMCKKGKDVVHVDYSLNVTNSYTLSGLIELGARTICLSPELSLDKIKKIHQNYLNSYSEILVYGKVKLMKMKYNPINNSEGYLIDRNNKKFLVKKGDNIISIYNHESIDLIEKIEELLKIGICNFRVDLLEESYEQSKKIVEKIHKKIFKE